MAKWEYLIVRVGSSLRGALVLVLISSACGVEIEDASVEERSADGRNAAALIASPSPAISGSQPYSLTGTGFRANTAVQITGSVPGGYLSFNTIASGSGTFTINSATGPVGTYQFSAYQPSKTGRLVLIASTTLIVNAPSTDCGDSVCNGAETCSSCAGDCGACSPPAYCGDSVCSGGETCSTCAGDCGACTVRQNTTDLSAVNFFDGTTVVASGRAGTILRGTVDPVSKKISWAKQTTNTSNVTFYSVGFAGSANDAVAVGGDPLFGGGAIRRSRRDLTTGQIVWDAQSSHIATSLTGVSFANSSTGVVVGQNYWTARTTQGGYDTGSGPGWIASQFGSDHFYEVQLVDASIGYATGSRGFIAKTSNGGASWSTIAAPYAVSPYSLYGVSFTDVNSGVVVGDQGTILRTTNGGATWSPQTSSTTTILRSVDCTAIDLCTAVGDGGSILRYSTINGILAWRPQYSGTPYSLSSVDFVDAQLGLVVGYAGLMFQTTNGGATWTNVSF